jgi:hypothetical protein
MDEESNLLGTSSTTPQEFGASSVQLAQAPAHDSDSG